MPQSCDATVHRTARAPICNLQSNDLASVCQCLKAPPAVAMVSMPVGPSPHNHYCRPRSRSWSCSRRPLRHRHRSAKEEEWGCGSHERHKCCRCCRHSREMGSRSAVFLRAPRHRRTVIENHSHPSDELEHDSSRARPAWKRGQGHNCAGPSSLVQQYWRGTAT